MARGTHPDPSLGQPIPYDPDFKGPLRNRSCTDVICLFVFMVFIGCWIGLGAFVFANGDPDKLLIPRDSTGSRCGFDAHVASKPYLFFFDLTKCISPTVPFTGCPTTQVCVSSCPDKIFLLTNSSSSSNMNDIICVDNERPTPSTVWDLIEKEKCAQWYLPSRSVLRRCVPNLNTNIDWDLFKEPDLMNVNKSTLESSIMNIEEMAKAEQVGHDIITDLENSWKEMLLGVGISIVFCFIYIVILRWVAPFMVWLSILGCLAGLAFCVYWSANNYTYFRDNPYEHETATSAIQAEFQKKGPWLGLLIAFSIVLGVLLIVVVFLRKRICLAIALIKEGSKAVSAVTSALFFPIVPWALQLGVIIYTVAVAIFLSTVGDPLYKVRNFDANNCHCTGDASHYENDVNCIPSVFESSCSNATTSYNCLAECRFIRMSNLDYVSYMHAFNIFAFFWGVFFVSALCEMILAATFATWYWTFRKTQVPFFTLTVAAARTFRYHIGTVAFGSLIIAICRMIRVMLEYLDHKLKKYDNAFTRAVLCCLKCFFWCLEKFLRFINRNAYIMCAIHGKNFCASAKDAFSLLMRNILRVFVLDKVTDFLFFLSKILVVIGVSAVVYSVIEYVSTTKLTYNFVPVIFVAICSYLISTVFFKVYTMAIDTLFLCFLEDSERNDGSIEKPYFMSKNLMKVLNKKNV